MIHVLELPWSAVDTFKEKYSLTMLKGGLALYKGALLPSELRAYSSDDFSYARWIEDEKNASVLPPKENRNNIHHDKTHENGAEKIKESFTNGAPGFLLLDKENLTPRTTAILSIIKIAEEIGYGPKTKGKLLILADSFMLSNWKNILYNFPEISAYLRVLLIDYKNMKKLLTPPATARLSTKDSVKNKQLSLKGTPSIKWEFIIADDFFLTKDSPQDLLHYELISLASLNKPYEKGQTPYTIFLNPKTSYNPLDYTTASQIISPHLSTTKTILPKEYADFLARNNFCIGKVRGKDKWGVLLDKKQTREEMLEMMNKDAEHIKKILYSSPNVLNRSSSQNYLPYVTNYLSIPIEIKGYKQENYLSAWKDLEKYVLKEKGTALKTEINRFNNRIGFIKKDYIVSLIEVLSNYDDPIYLRVSNKELADDYKKTLIKKGVSAANITGLKLEDQRELWTKFKTKAIQVLISSHLPKALYEETQASTKSFDPRIIITDLQREDYSNELRLIFKDSRNPVVYLPYIDRTIEDELTQEYIELKTTKNFEYSSYTKYTERLVKTAVSRTTPLNRIN